MLGELDQTNSSDVDMESRKRCLTSPEAIKKPGEDCISRPAKKLKQARLPFATISKPPGTQLLSPNDRPSKKRKLSETDPNASSPQPTTKSKDKISVTPSNKKTATKAGSKRTPVRLVKAPESSLPVVETEVSSSSEDPPAATPTKSPCKKRPKPLDRFLQASQEPTSTSEDEVIDLTEKDSTAVKDAEPSSGGDAEPTEEEGKDKKSSSPDEEPVTTVEDSNDATNEEQVADVDSVKDDDEASADESALDSSIGSEANTSNESEASQPETTDKNTKPADSSVSCTPKSAPKPPRKTPSSARSLEKEKEREQKRLEREKLKEERRLKAEAEKEEKRKQKEAAKAERDAKAAEAKAEKDAKLAEAKRLRELEKEEKLKEKKQKMEEEEKKRLEQKEQKEEKQRQRMQEIEAKNEEKKKKDEEKRKQDEEKNQKEALKRQVSEKQQNMFKSFFKKVEKPVAPKEPEEKLCGGFVPFQLQQGMALAPVYGFDKLKSVEAKEEFDAMTTSQDVTDLYLKQLKAKAIRPGKREKTLVQKDSVVDQDEDSIQMLEDIKEKPKKTKAKLLQFHENHRPAYYGTWTKTSQKISPRNYMKKDEDFLDYEFDSDEEWEEPGESLSDSEGEGESDADSDNGDSDNDGFFVEHGYLSESEDPMDEEETVEQWRAKRKAKALAWEVELKRQTKVLKPIIVGCVWLHGCHQNQSKFAQIKLEAFKAVTLVDVPIKTMSSDRKSPLMNEEGRSLTPSGDPKPKSKACPKMPVPEEAMPDLIRLVHGNTIGVKSVIREFREYWRLKQLPKTPIPPSTSPTNSESLADKDERSVSPMPTPSTTSGTTTPCPSPSVNSVPNGETDTPRSTPTGEINSTNSTPEEPEKEYTISKRQVEKKIASIAVREKRPDYPRICWYVRAEIIDKYKMTDLRVPSEWQYITGPLAGKRSDSPLPGQNNILPPQKVVSTPSTSARRIVPTKVASPSAASVISMLQQQKARQVASLASQAALPGASGLLANAAKAFVESTTPLVGGNQPTIIPQSHPQMVLKVPSEINTIVTVPTMPQITQNASVLVASRPATEVIQLNPAVVLPQKQAKKVRTLDSFFGGKKSTAQKTDNSKPKSPAKSENVPLKVASGEEKMEVTDADTNKVTTTTEIVNLKITSEEKMESVESSTPGLVDSTKPQIAVLKDLLSKAKVNRINQLSPDRKKPGQVLEKILSKKENSNAKDVISIDEDDVILLD